MLATSSLKYCLLSSALLGGVRQVLAQTTEPRNLATDTLQPANPKFYVPISRLGTMSGQQLYVFVSNVSERGTGIEFTWRNPLSSPRPKPVFIYE